MPYYIILCEGKTDSFIINLIMGRYGFKYLDKKRAKDKISFKTLKNQNLDYFTDGSYCLIIWNTAGCTNIPYAVDEIKKLMLNIGDEIESLAIVMDKDFNTETQLLSQFSSFFNLEGNLKNAVWNKHNYRDAFSEEKALKILLNVIPHENFGALETLMFDSLKNRGKEENEMALDVESMVDGFQTKKISYFEKDRAVIKSKLGCMVNLLDPERTFYDIIDSFSGIAWEEDENVIEHFQSLNRYK
ncbi:MAG: DUF3226 domain-containing protein [Cetobacterium sp.]|uniref:DUF3226 domain-containing protein n=1 Tax=Cetobacterium sp. TaxID=2071632 RepID=UPI0025D9CEE3|nr:DUF3226 domain-containing protein [uncultured Cetobacterium sp.]